ncbi:MAG: polysaccharide biosynthesis tyrosine autokinase, partial [Verrucomicrobiota bacterium]
QLDPTTTDAILTQSANKSYIDTKKDISGLETQLGQLSEFLTDKHPKIIGLKESIERKEQLLEVAEKQGIEQLLDRKDALLLKVSNTQELIKEWEQKSREAGRLVADHDNLKADVERLKELRNRLSDVTVNLDVSTSTSQVSISILETASEAAKSRPGILKALLTASLIGLLAGIGILFVLDRIDDRVNSFSEFRDYFEEEVLGQVPFEKEVAAGSDRIPLLQSDDERQVYSESFRNIRSSLMYMATDGERPKVILVTSAIPGEGKSTVACNLARTLAFSGASTLLIDGDIRKGVVHEEFKISKEKGLADVLEGAMEWKEAIQEVDLPSLSVISRGSPKKSIGELLIHPISSSIIKEMKSQYDHVIIDSPPVLAADDTPSLAPKVDGVIMVMRSSFTSSRLTQTSLDQLRQRQANIIGIVINCINTSLPDYYHYEYYRSYYQEPVTETKKS